MQSRLSSQEIGRRVANLRKRRGYSQEELSRLVGISRPSVAQLEAGRRKISIEEFIRISEVLGFSMDRFLAQAYDEEIVDLIPEKSIESDVRVSVSKLHVRKFKEILMYILEKTAGKPNVGETVLNKLLYFSDFDYYEQFEQHLTGAEYRKLPYGPVPQKLDGILEMMIKDGWLQRISTEYHGFPQKRYIPLQKADLSVLNASELAVIEQVIHQYSDWSARKISAYSHNDMPWKASEEGQIIDYELAFYREAPFSARRYDDEL